MLISMTFLKIFVNAFALPLTPILSRSPKNRLLGDSQTPLKIHQVYKAVIKNAKTLW